MVWGDEMSCSCILRYYEPDENKLLRCGVVSVGENNSVTVLTEKSPTRQRIGAAAFHFTKKHKNHK